ncbi:hypothetical protein [Janthinobacterium sp.]|uniref:hypothetical protein n=1 Tax=Janthinobacterium sp. TaxID=1871054 RepID=UPI00262BD263|nr:hypothetical protein [Janthinobacterium sp.]
MQNQEKVIAANKRLAELLGWTNLIDAGGALVGTPPDGAADSRGQAMVPNWAGDWAAAGPLLAQFEISPLFMSNYVAARAWYEPYSAHGGDRDATARFAIARAATYRLEQAR